jgi:hypothetical protein
VKGAVGCVHSVSASTQAGQFIINTLVQVVIAVTTALVLNKFSHHFLMRCLRKAITTG